MDDYLAVMWNGNICVAKVKQPVNNSSNICCVYLDAEYNSLVFSTSIEKDGPIHNIIQVLPKTSLSCKDDEITLTEDIYSNLKHRFEKEGTTIEEETFEITENDLNETTHVNRRGRAVGQPNYLSDYV